MADLLILRQSGERSGATPSWKSSDAAPWGGVKVLDLGLVRFDSRAAFESIAQLTAEGFIVGTPAYMSPEQLDGNEVDFRNDLLLVALRGI